MLLTYPTLIQISFKCQLPNVSDVATIDLRKKNSGSFPSPKAKVKKVRIAEVKT